MKRAIIICFIILLLIYGICAVLVPCGIYEWETYYKITAIVGCIASVLGFGAAALGQKDLLSYESEAIKRLAQAAEDIENKESQIKDASDKIASLEYKKEELEVLVKKASLTLFYKEELERLYQRLLRIINKNDELNDTIMSISQTEEKLRELEGEIANNPEISDILSTIQKARGTSRHPRTLLEALMGSFTVEMNVK